MSDIIAVESLKDGVLTVFGYGKHIGDKVPDVAPWNRTNIPNPCILLDNGKYVWGFQCWWGKKDAFLSKYGEHIKEEKVSDTELIIIPLGE